MKNENFRNNKDLGRYELDVDGQTCLVDYVVNDDGWVFLTHTEVPLRLEGRGHGTELMRNVLEDIGEQGRKVVPRCSFAAAYVKRHPQWTALLAPGIILK